MSFSDKKHLRLSKWLSTRDKTERMNERSVGSSHTKRINYILFNCWDDSRISHRVSETWRWAFLIAFEQQLNRTKLRSKFGRALQHKNRIRHFVDHYQMDRIWYFSVRKVFSFSIILTEKTKTVSCYLIAIKWIVERSPFLGGGQTLCLSYYRFLCFLTLPPYFRWDSNINVSVIDSIDKK